MTVASENNGDQSRQPWVLVAGGFHNRGGMDKANAALALYLLERGHPVHLVGHQVAEDLAIHPRVTVYLAPRPAGSVLLGERHLNRLGRRVAREVAARWPGTRVVSNGGNCVSPDINWVHAVHHAWPPADDGAPLWFRAKNRLWHARARRLERRALRAARLIIANSERTRCDLIHRVGLQAERVHTVYLGGEIRKEATTEERRAARGWLGFTADRPLVLFIGALGHDHNKGFDTLWRAWKNLCARSDWDADLLVVGGGRGVARWRELIGAENLSPRVKLLGFTERISDVLAAGDLLVSPVRYEAYGLNVHEAICRGVPALVSRRAGIAERYPAALSELLLPDAEDADDLASRLLNWRRHADAWKEKINPLAVELRRRTWADTAAEIVALAEAESDGIMPGELGTHRLRDLTVERATAAQRA